MLEVMDGIGWSESWPFGEKLSVLICRVLESHECSAARGGVSEEHADGRVFRRGAENLHRCSDC